MPTLFSDKSGNWTSVIEMGWFLYNVQHGLSGQGMKARGSFPPRCSYKVRKKHVFPLFLLPLLFTLFLSLVPLSPHYQKSIPWCPTSICSLKHCLRIQISPSHPLPLLSFIGCLLWWSVDCNGLKKRFMHMPNFSYSFREFSSLQKPGPPTAI